MESDSEDDAAGYEIEEIDAPGPQPQEGMVNFDMRMDDLPPGESLDMPPPQMKPREGPRRGPPPRGAMKNSKSHNTGPKGVRADYEEAKYNTQNIRMRERIQMERDMQRLALGKKNFVVKSEKSESDSESDSDLESDDEGFRQYKLKRLQAVKDSLPTFGLFQRVTPGQYASVVKTAHKLVHIVVHLYQNHNETCVRLNLSFEELAEQFPQVCFIRVRATDAIQGYSDVGLPTIMIYKGGEMVHSFVRAHEAIGKVLSDYNIAMWLKGLGVLNKPTEALQRTERKRNHTRADSEDDECCETGCG